MYHCQSLECADIWCVITVYVPRGMWLIMWLFVPIVILIANLYENQYLNCTWFLLHIFQVWDRCIRQSSVLYVWWLQLSVRHQPASQGVCTLAAACLMLSIKPPLCGAQLEPFQRIGAFLFHAVPACCAFSALTLLVGWQEGHPFTFLVPAHLGSPGQRAVKRMLVLCC